MFSWSTAHLSPQTFYMYGYYYNMGRNCTNLEKLHKSACGQNGLIAAPCGQCRRNTHYNPLTGAAVYVFPQGGSDPDTPEEHQL